VCVYYPGDNNGGVGRYIRDCGLHDVGEVTLVDDRIGEVWVCVVSSSITAVVYGRGVLGRCAGAVT
jgi:hypothetical protein